MKLAIKMTMGMSAGYVAGKIIFGLSREYCGNGFFTGLGTAALSVAVAVYGYSTVSGMLEGIGLKDDDNKEEEDG